MEQGDCVVDMVIGDSQPLCATCGQEHSVEENHVYSYPEEVDDDLICHICLQALLQPLDTPCGHTYCTLCLTNFLFEKDFCPVDRRIVLLQTCKRSNILVHKLLDKLLVTCPFRDYCTEMVQRCDLELHLKQRCKGATHYGLHKEQKRRSEDDANDDSTPELIVANLSPELCASAAVALMTEEPGLINPALSPNTEDSQSGNSSEESSRLNRHRTRHFERSTVRSRSFKKLNRAFSVLRRTKSGSAVINPLERDRDRESPPYPNPIEEVLPQLYHLIPDGEITNIKINRSEPNESLAIRIVGGSETPLVHIIIQHVYRDGVIARDGRLLPGDMILKVNGIDISSVPHSFAVSVLKQPCQVLRLTVLREQRFRCRNNGFVSDGLVTSETLHITLNKGGQDVQLGIKLVRRLDGGVLIFSLQDGGVAARDRQLQENDRILAINGHDLRHGTPESAALLIQASEETVHFLVSRQTRPPTPDILQEAGWNNNGSGSPQTCPMDRNHINKSALQAVTCHEKVVNISKDHTESLGMIVAGGVSHREWDLPIYVVSVEPDGVISRDGRIKTGDILLSVNGIELTGVSRGEAVALLKNTSSCVVLKALETRENESQENVTNNILFLDSNRNTPDTTSEWSPPWLMWLKLPRYLCSCKEIVLRRNTAGSLGFSFIGGYEELSGNVPFLIKSIVEGTPAYNDGRLRCGDVLLAVNGRSVSGMMHCSLVKMLKELKGRVALAVVSWPGSLL